MRRTVRLLLDLTHPHATVEGTASLALALDGYISGNGEMR